MNSPETGVRSPGGSSGRLLVLGLALLLGAAGPARAVFDEIIAGARPQGLGGSFVAVADDANALFWNPAGLVQSGTAETTFMHANEFDLTVGPELKTDFIGFVNWPMNIGYFGISAFQQGAEEILRERTLSLSYANHVSDYGAIGINIKALELEGSGRQVNPDDPAVTDQTTFSLDIGGLLWITPSWRLGVLARNLGGELGVGVEEDLRNTYRIGSAYRLEDLIFLDDAFTWSLDLFTRRDIGDEPGIQVKVSTGIEYTVDERVTFRVGADRGDLTLGLGFGHPEAGIFVDYAWADNDLGKTHRISATYRFGLPRSEVHVVHHPPPPPPPPPPEPEIEVELQRETVRVPAGDQKAAAPNRPFVRDTARSEFETELTRFLDE